MGSGTPGVGLVCVWAAVAKRIVSRAVGMSLMLPFSDDGFETGFIASVSGAGMRLRHGLGGVKG
jgi:hypothetical protein